MRPSPPPRQPVDANATPGGGASATRSTLPGAIRKRALLAALGAAALAAIGHWVWLGQPVAIAEPGAERVECVSYAPFRRPGETPFDPTARVDEARIETDLRTLSERSACVRTYSVSQGLDAVPRVARRLGMTVLLGAWIGRDRLANDAELAQAIGIAREHAGTVRALVVGNEVMLRRELPEAELVGYIERARREVPVPVTYADVWEFWLKHPTIAPAVTFVTIHILPYWEDEPVGIDAAIAHVRDVYRAMQAALPGREILVGETGWPSAGRARRDAVPGRVEQARFVRQFTRMAAEERIGYNLIEAFDQPWKRHLEGAMGGHWGIYDSEGRAKFDWHGAVVPRPDWRVGLWAALGGALLGAAGLAAAAAGGASSARRAAGGASSARRAAGGASSARRAAAGAIGLHATVGAAAGAGLGAMFAEQLAYMTLWNRDPLEWGVTSAATAAAFACSATSAALLARRLAATGPAAAPPPGLPPGPAALPSGSTTVPGAATVLPGPTSAPTGSAEPPAAATSVLPGAAAVLRGWLRGGVSPSLEGWVALLHGAVLFGAALTVVLHGFDARYRGFDWPLFASPAVAAALLLGSGLRRGDDAVEERWLAGVLVAGAAVMVVSEGPANLQALGYAALMVALAACAFARASTSSPSSAPAPAGS